MDIATLLTWAGMQAAGLLWGYIPGPATPQGVEIQQAINQQSVMPPMAPTPGVTFPDPVRSTSTSVNNSRRR